MPKPRAGLVLPWDTEFFGLRIGDAGIEGAGGLDEAIGWARDARVDCLYVRIPAADVETITAATRAGARLVDLRVVLELQEVSHLTEAAGVRPAVEADREQLHAAAADLAGESRFSRDPRFERRRVEDMYRIWLDQCLADGVVAIAGEGAAFVAGRGVEPAVLELVYVAPEARGRGLAANALVGALTELGAVSARVATQAGNVAANRLYQRLGFRVCEATAILHLWPDEAAPFERAVPDATRLAARGRPRDASS
jgi:ribosomal protein S18 acetylase RimI-like enzyme